MNKRRHLRVLPGESHHDALTRERQDPEWRAAAGDAARQLEEQAAGKGDLEAKVVEAATMVPTSGGVPVNFQGGIDDGSYYSQRGRDAAVIHGATAADVDKYAIASHRTCGHCRHFQLEQGRKEMVKQKFLQRVVLDEQWKLDHLGAPTDHLGICGQKPSMVTSTVTNAGTCSGFQARDGIFRRK